jgi:hypothetical protein
MSLRGLGVQVCSSHVPNTEAYVSRSPSVRLTFTLLPEIAPFSASVHIKATQNDQHGGERLFIACPRRFEFQHRCARSCTVIGVCACVCVCVRLVQDRCGMVLCFRDNFCYRIKLLMSMQPPCTWHRSSRCSPSVVRTERGAAVFRTEQRRL